MAISPAASTVTTNHATFTVAGAGSLGVRWSLSANIGTITTTTTQAVYIPPAVFTTQNLTLTATDIAMPANTATAVIKLTAPPAINISLSPASLHLTTAGEQNFLATVTGTSNTAVKWSIAPAIGTVSQSGMYVAPPVKATTHVTLTAVSTADSTRTATAAITLDPTSPLSFTTYANGLNDLVFNGVNYNYLYGEGLLSYVTTQAPGSASVFATPACGKGSFTATVVTNSCTSGGVPIGIQVSYSTPDPSTVTAVIQVTNNSTTDTLLNATVSTLGVEMSAFNTASSRVQSLNSSNPLSYVNFGLGEWAIWNNAPSPDVTMGMQCGWSYLCKNQPVISNIGPGKTKTASFSLRFSSDPNVASIDLAPEAYSEFAATYPSVVNWPDRRPVMAWFISDYSKRSATNPRGYLQQPNLNASDVAGFGTQVIAAAQNVISLMKNRPVQPQGILIWDLEGQEFIQPTTYVGDPRVFSEGYAPEMNAVADQLFALFKSAGYKTGVTLRPQQLRWGTQLPATCQYNSSNDYKDYYIKVDAPYLQRFYACYDPNGVSWSLIPQGNGGQTFYQPTQPDAVTALLMSKVTYAHSRWGTTIYYVDTSVWSGGSPLPPDIFKQLQLAFPDCVFIPEESVLETMATSLPYTDPNVSSGFKFSPVTWRYVYPNGAAGVYLANCQGTCWSTNYNNFLIGQKIGDMPIYTQPQQISSTQLQNIESMILTARSQMSAITVTNTSTGLSYSYQGSASAVYQYPVKMRVYFAASQATASASTVYCESGQWLGENTCSLDLTGLLVAQIRYYDFAGNLVVSEQPTPR